MVGFDTAHLHFDEVRVPVSHLLGQENAGFKVIMNNFNMERFWLGAIAYGYALVCYEEALEWAQQRKTFGKRLIDHQVVRHKLVDMATQLTATRALLEDTAYRMGKRNCKVVNSLHRYQCLRTLLLVRCNSVLMLRYRPWVVWDLCEV
jgi:alkylation response protein AidB-like acyl-CoA dehydrogenase